MRVRLLSLVAAVVLCAVVCAGVVGVAPAFAVVGQFGGAGEGAGQFEGPSGVAVDQESGAVYLVDSENHRLDKFGGEGSFLWASGWGVADGHSKASQVCTSVCSPGLQGGGGGEFGFFTEGVAVDNDPLSASHSDVYVFDLGANRVEKFDSSGDFLLTFGHEVNATTHADVCLAGETCQGGMRGSNPGELEPEAFAKNIAVAPSGSVLVGDAGSRVQEFSPGGAYEGQIALPGVGAIKNLAVDETGDVYVEGSEVTGVHKFDGTGVELGAPRDASGSSGALAVGPAGELFVDDTSGGGRHVLEFEPSGGEVARFDAASEAVGGRGLAFGEALGVLYVPNASSVRLVSPPPPGPLVVSQPVAEPQPTTAPLAAVLNPENHETTYHVEYGTTAAYGSSTTPAVLAGSAFEDEPVSMALSGLQPRTTYHLRLVASNSAGTTFGADQTFTTLPPASIDGESVSRVTSNSATLAAQLNPLGRDTTYHFEYGPNTGYGSSVPVPAGDAGSGTADVALSAPVEGLAPGTVYHYRLVAVNALGTVEGADRVFTTQAPPTSGLLDGRAWEMVSPPDKHGATLESLSPTAGGLAQAARDGSGVSYLATGPVEGEPAGNRSLLFSQVLSRRGVDGWTSRDIATPSEVPAWASTLSTGEYRLFDGDLSAGLVEPQDKTVLAPGAAPMVPYRREADGGFTPLVLAAGLPAGSQFTGGVDMLKGASPDLSHIVLSSIQPLLPGVPNSGNTSLYEWSGGSLSAVSILPNGKQAAEEQSARLGYLGAVVQHAVSDDGSRIVWSAKSPGVRALYLRDVRLGGTVRLDVVESGAQGGGVGESGAVYQTASSDGSRVFFLDDSKLTRNATSARRRFDLYMCEVGEAAGEPTCALRDLTVDQNAGEAADVQENVLGAGEDGRYVYFVASGVLAAGATPGANNLYVEDTVTGTRRLVATLSSEDKSDWAWWALAGIVGMTARVSPDGRYLAFMSQRSLTGYDNVDANSGQPDMEVFLYDTNSNSVVCVSCNPSGARPTGVFDPARFPGLLVNREGGSHWLEGHWLAGSIPGWGKADDAAVASWYQPDYLSDSGRLFFNAADALVPGDTNGLEDVYEYEPGGVGGCAGPGGCVGLMSSGTSKEESALLDASKSGNDVFFLTASRLVPRDTDSELDVYDARVCTGSSPCLAAGAAPSSPVPCEGGDACRGAGSGLPGVFAAPSSTAVSAGGNLAPQPPAKPVVKTKPVSRARKLAGALRVCRKKAKRKQRVSCEARARRFYGKGARAGTARGAGASRKGQG